MKRAIAAIAFAALASWASAQDGTAIRRFALVAGADDGGYDRVRLRYAVADARSFAQVLEQLGGVKAEDRILLVNPDFNAFQEGLRRIRAAIQAATSGSERRELIVYYSGHADEEGLLLGRERFPYSRLRREVSDVDADVRVAVVDSCSSGSLTRAKGGALRPAFLVDSSTEMKGYAFLTSSSENEVAQESDRIGGSFFTHYLVGGLRGAADSNDDGLVTLNEAYAYAFAETLASTEGTQYGPQHPAYDISLTGKGDLVLTDLRQAAARLVIAPEVSGRLFVRDRDGALVAETAKRSGDPLQLGLEPGTYVVRLQQGDRWYEAEVPLGREARLERSAFRPLPGEATVRRGPGDSQAAGPASDSYRASTFHFSVLPELGGEGVAATREQYAISLNLLVGDAAAVDGVVLSGLGSVVADRVDGLQASGLGSVVGQDLWGAQLAGIVNYAGRDAGFYQGAGVVNLTRGALLGAQQAGVLNLALGGVEGLQLAGVANISGEATTGAQLAGLFNSTQADLRGAQASGVGNLAGVVIGGQASGIFNRAEAFTGAQLSLVNVAGGMNGAQVGLVNVARDARGVQIGLVNISERFDGVPIGLINYERDGSQHLELTWEGDRVGGAIRLGAGYVYTLLRGAVVSGSDPLEWSFGAGLGVEIPLAPFFVDADASLSQWLVGSQAPAEWDPASLRPEIRLAAGYELRGGFGVLVGTAVELEVPGWHSSRDSALRLKPAAFVGVQVGTNGRRPAAP